MASQTLENYLKTIFHLSLQQQDISITDIATALQVRVPTVNSMVKKLADHGYIYYEKYRPLAITELGKTTAALIIRKHRLTEMFLVQKMGFGWEEVHDVAEQIEHIESPLFFSRIDEILGFPKYDPHGSPIPDVEGNIHVRPLKQLSSCGVGEKIELLGVGDTSDAFLKYLNGKILGLGSEIVVNNIEDYDGSMEVTINQSAQQILSKVVADKLLVDELK
jgi:DtxR family transcriptional regulator, Mn-dependent transcriptional regulator